MILRAPEKNPTDYQGTHFSDECFGSLVKISEQFPAGLKSDARTNCRGAFLKTDKLRKWPCSQTALNIGICLCRCGTNFLIFNIHSKFCKFNSDVRFSGKWPQTKWEKYTIVDIFLLLLTIFWQFLTILTVFGNFDNFWRVWQFWTILTTF